MKTPERELEEQFIEKLRGLKYDYRPDIHDRDMLLTGFDSKYLNTLYVDKNLKQHGLIQAFSRTNRVLNASKPYGHILDFRGQQEAVDQAITLFSGMGAESDHAREIWLVEKAPRVIVRLKAAKQQLDEFMQSQGLEAKPEAVPNLRGDDARAAFIKHFKEVQRLQTQLDQYTDLTPEQEQEIDQTLPKDDLRGFRGVYIETAQRLKTLRETPSLENSWSRWIWAGDSAEKRNWPSWTTSCRCSKNEPKGVTSRG